MTMRLNGWQRIGVVPLVVWFLAGGFSGVIARSQEVPSQAPQVNTEKRSELSEAETEFWPPLFGYRLKVTRHSFGDGYVSPVRRYFRVVVVHSAARQER
jgi:hypothetical protein